MGLRMWVQFYWSLILKKQGRPRTRAKKAGILPRSFGIVLETIRVTNGLTQSEMHERLQSIPSPFPMPKQRGKGANPAATISGWEMADFNVPFSVQHRYGMVAHTYSGALHLISLFYANFRDAADFKFDLPARKQKLEQNVIVAEKLSALANYVKSKSQSDQCADVMEGNASNNDATAASHFELIKQMLESLTNS